MYVIYLVIGTASAEVVASPWSAHCGFVSSPFVLGSYVSRVRLDLTIRVIFLQKQTLPALDRESLLPLASNTGTVTKRNRLVLR